MRRMRGQLMDLKLWLVAPWSPPWGRTCQVSGLKSLFKSQNFEILAEISILVSEMLSWSWWCTRRSALPETWCSWRKGGRGQVVKFSCQASPCQGWGRLVEMTRAEVWWGEATGLVGKDGMISFAPKESDPFSNILINNRSVRRWSISGSLWFRGRAKSSTGETLSSNRGKNILWTKMNKICYFLIGKKYYFAFTSTLLLIYLRFFFQDFIIV